MPPNDRFKAPKSPLMNYMNYKNKSYTLVEIMAVMTIIVIMLSIGVSGYRNITSQSSFIIESNDVITRVRKAMSNAARSNTPTILLVQTGSTMSGKSYFFGGKTSLHVAFDFDTRTKDREWTPEKGFRNLTLNSTGTIKESFHLSDYGMAYFSKGSTLTIDGGDEMSNAAAGVYIECKIKCMPNTQIDIGSNGVLFQLENASMYIDKDTGELVCQIGSDTFPSSTDEKRVRVDTGEWLKVGMSISAHQQTMYVNQFINGQVTASYEYPNHVESVGFGNSPQFCTNYQGFIDDIRIYDCLKGDAMAIDPKAGFIINANGVFDSYNKNTAGDTFDNYNAILIDGNGAFVPFDSQNSQGNDWYGEMIAVASSSIYGSLQRKTSWNNETWYVEGSKISNAPENGYFLLYNRNHAKGDFFEVIKYSDFDGDSFKRQRQKLQTDAKTGDRRDYFRVRYIKPVVLSSN